MSEKPKGNPQNNNGSRLGLITAIIGLITVVIGLIPIPQQTGGTAPIICKIIISVNSTCFGIIQTTQTPVIITTAETQITANPIPTVQVTPSQDASPVVAQLNSVLGEGNWFCFPDKRNAVGIYDVNAASQPILSSSLFYELHESGMGPGTGWIRPPLSSYDDCPAEQHELISSWQEAHASTEVNSSLINSILGTGNWHCGNEFGAVMVNNIPQALTTLEFPFIAADVNGSKYGIGETVQTSMSATFWLGESCPH